MFTEDSYTASERDHMIQLRVKKNKLIASPVTLRVTAMTIQEAITVGVFLPPNIPRDDPLSPNRASKE